MERDPAGHDRGEEAALDELLLLMLGGSGERIAEVFHERSRRLALGLTLGPEGELRQAPVRRDDQGTALRLLAEDGLRRAHCSGAAASELGRLAAGLAGAGEPEESPVPPQGPLDPGSEGLAARRLDEAAAFLRDAAGREPRLERASLRLRRDERLVRVASSEWGQAADERRWWRLELELELADEEGRRGRATRGCGWSEAPARGFGALVDELFDRASSDLGAGAAPPGSPPVVLAAGGGAVLFHEAVGHALEGDVVGRAGTVLSGKRGDVVAPGFLSVHDDPGLPGLAGSLRCDDEGLPPRSVALIEAGRVGAPLADALRSGFERERATGHGRRASHRVPPRPRMTNTYVAPGGSSLEELLAPVSRGLLVERLERGAFEPATGAFRLRVAESRLIERGKPTRPLRPFWLEGDTLSLLAGVEELGAELAWDDGCGSCGRDGQWLPVASGCPALRIAEGVLRVL